MARKGAILWLLFVGIILGYAFPISSVGQDKEVKLLLFDAFEKKPLDEVIVSTKILDKATNKILTITEYAVDNEISLVLPLDANLDITVDIPSTEGKDFFSHLESKNLNASETVYLLPVSTLDLAVVDSLDNRVSYAGVSVLCEKEYGINYEDKTDKYGSFTSLLPTGRCTIHVEKEGKAGSKTIMAPHGEIVHIKIKFRDSRLLALLFVAFGGILAAIWFVLKRTGFISLPKRTTTIVEKKEQQGSATTRIQTILQTLSERERLVVQHLLANKAESTQARIRHATHIPKTSLARILEGLQKKGILSYDSDGLTKKVNLTTWFMNAEK